MHLPIEISFSLEQMRTFFHLWKRFLVLKWYHINKLILFEVKECSQVINEAIISNCFWNISFEKLSFIMNERCKTSLKLAVSVMLEKVVRDITLYYRLVKRLLTSNILLLKMHTFLASISLQPCPASTYILQQNFANEAFHTFGSHFCFCTNFTLSNCC